MAAASAWQLPLLVIEYPCEWLAYLLSRWSFLEVLEYLGSFSILIAVIFYFSESGDRLKAKALSSLAGDQHGAGNGRQRRPN